MNTLKGVTITINYPDDECEAAVPSDMTVHQLAKSILTLVQTERDMTSFVIVAVIDKAETA